MLCYERRITTTSENPAQYRNYQAVTYVYAEIKSISPQKNGRSCPVSRYTVLVAHTLQLHAQMRRGAPCIASLYSAKCKGNYEHATLLRCKLVSHEIKVKYQ